jgi:hypothetical protein
VDDRDDDVDIHAVEAHVRATPPSCVRAFRLSPAQLPKPFDDNLTTVWRLACQCGSESGRLLGHRLDSLSSSYRGDLLVGPLGFECSACGSVTELLDTDVHGYHAEVGKLEGGIGSTKIRGTGPRTAHACPACGRDSFGMVAGFVYWHFDLIEDEPHLPAEEFFNVFLLYCTCAACGHVSEPTQFGKL